MSTMSPLEAKCFSEIGHAAMALLDRSPVPTIAAVNGYALANWKFKGADTFFAILIFGAFIPYQVMLYPVVIILRSTARSATLTAARGVAAGTRYRITVQAVNAAGSSPPSASASAQLGSSFSANVVRRFMDCVRTSIIHTWKSPFCCMYATRDPSGDQSGLVR